MSSYFCKTQKKMIKKKREDTEEMHEFIDAYKSMSELWNTKLESYKNKKIRQKCYEKLLIKYRKVKRDATLEELKKKIANMRTCYRRELKKKINTERSGAGADEIYQSNLWYFDLFDFLHDVEMPNRFNFSSDEDDEVPSLPSSIRKVKKRSPSPDNAQMEFLKKATQHLEASNTAAQKDDASVYGSAWACMFRQMAPEQQLFAKQAVDEIMLLGRMNKLTLNYLHSSRVSSSPSVGYLSKVNTLHSDGTSSEINLQPRQYIQELLND